MVDVCPWVSMEPSPHSMLSPPTQKLEFWGHTVLCPHSFAQPYGRHTRVLMHLHPFRGNGGGMVCSLGKTSPLATEMIKVSCFPAISTTTMPSSLSPYLKWCSRCSPFRLILSWGGGVLLISIGSLPPSQYQVSRFTMVMLVAAQPTPTLPCRDLATMPGNHGSSSSGGECGEVGEERVWQWSLRKKGQFASPEE